jgi:hypothetical protein
MVGGISDGLAHFASLKNVGPDFRRGSGDGGLGRGRVLGRRTAPIV